MKHKNYRETHEKIKQPIMVFLKNWKVLLVLLVVIGIYSNILNNSLVWDDATFIKDWPERRDLIGNFWDFWRGEVAPRQEGVYRPVRSVWYGLTYYIFGENAALYHAASVVMHIVTVMFVYLIVKELINEKTGVLAGLIFGVHPINVEAVAWITASFDSAGILLALVSIYLFLKSKSMVGGFFSVLFACAAYFNNEVTLVLPGLLLLIDWYKKEITTKNWKKKIARYIPYIVGVFVFLGIRMIGLGIVSRQEYMYDSLLVTGLIGARSIAEFARSFLIPVGLGPIHVLSKDVTSFFYHDFNFEKPFPEPNIWQMEIFLSIALLMAFLVFLKKNKDKNRELCFSVTWFVVALLPVTQIVPQSIIFAEGEAYLAGVGGAFGLAVLLLKLTEKRKFKLITKGLAGMFLVSLAVSGFYQTKIWASEETLWSRAMEIYPESTLVHTNLGKYYFENGDKKTGLGYLEKAVDLNNNNILALTNLGVAYSQIGESDKGIVYLEKANKLQPGYYASEKNLALVYIDVGNGEAARGLLQKMVSKNPDDFWPYLQIAKSFHKQFVFNQAENYYLKVLEIEPENLDALNNLGNLYVEWGRTDEARSKYEKVLEIDENYGDVREKLEEISNF